MFSDAYDLFWQYQDTYLTGLQNALSAAAVGLLLAFLVGMTTGIVRFATKGMWARLAAGYVSLVRNTPLLVQVYFIYFGLPAMGVTISAFWTGVIALTFNSGAYIAEMVRGGFSSISRGQSEAAMSLGLRKPLLLRKVLLPQAAPIILPAITGQFVQLIKDTSLLYTISVLEITKAADDVGNETYQFLPAYLVSCVMYIVICIVLNLLVDLYESRAGFSQYKRA
ncbi:MULTISPECIES: amino acid ABC transporter permease [unclassified Rhizobium]|uniref:amino acid ABC transporter permease n=1 Tax=unclassified Rhizobium TaxID=2613769 RepID=UPI001ADC7D05|nr:MULTISPECIES: amino acid ABC transporter permease [unclassified Rhizobium]MBO9127716.1 amino acid ABC transporter permease [Rhizobium sp. 16-488-2b]MBO9178178.1 amino acid ABC transporter permease [Rhizobium sp. 16-488-2a]